MALEAGDISYVLSDGEIDNSSTDGAYFTPLSELNVTYSDSDLLRFRLGERYMSPASLVVLNVIYIAIFFSGLLGNVCTCIVIAKNRSMHTATNYYLFSLAISDLLTLLLALPPELYMYWEAYPWRFGQVFCILKSYIQEMTSYASVLTIAAFTIERYLAICHPMTQQVLNNPSRAIKLLLIQWIVAILCALPFAIYTRTFYFVHRPDSGKPVEESLICNVPGERRDLMTYFFQISTFVFFVYPMSVILIMYVLIGLRLSKSTPVSNDRSNLAVVQARKAVIKMLVAVVAAFFLCWAPFHAQRLMTIYIKVEEWTPTLLDIQTHLFLISGVLYYVSSTINPILYNAMSKKYRHAFIRTILPCIKSHTVFHTSTFHSNSPASKSSPYFYNKLSARPITRTSGLQEFSQEDNSAV